MAKLYILIYLAGKLVGTIGPLPYGMDECHERIAEKMATVNSDEFKRRAARESDLNLRCEFHETRPRIEGGPVVSMPIE